PFCQGGHRYRRARSPAPGRRRRILRQVLERAHGRHRLEERRDPQSELRQMTNAGAPVPAPQSERERFMSISALRKRPAWEALERHYRKIEGAHLRQLFAEDEKRGEALAVEAAGIYFDYSKNRITNETVRLLLQLADESALRERIDAMFRG